MKKKILVIILAICAACVLLTGCNPIARKFGGTITVDLKPGEKLINCTWKVDSLWILTKKMNESDVAEIYTFKEDSTFGVLEGTVTIIEHKN